tara:strand:- start:31 stop:546 length:516 start_codon:yes stop_codon:yes gene_type:complete
MIFINTLLIAFEESNVNSYIDTYFYKSMEQLASYPPLLLFPLLCIYIFFFILFFQSGLDKVFNWQSELKWIKSHFSKTIFKSFVPTLLCSLMLLEIITGLMCIFSVVHLFFPIYDYFPFLALFFSSCTLLCLFLGQRIAKDYQGAISIAVYFGINLGGLFILFLCDLVINF